jgi:hypothetical protein
MPRFVAAKSFYRDMVGVARANILPALVLQAIAVFLLWAYHYWPTATNALNELARIKVATGFMFAFVASAIAGAVLPLLLQSLQRGTHRRIAANTLPALFLFWGLRGCLVDAFYQIQTALWGNSVLPAILAIKIFCDLAIASPLVFLPFLVLIFSWADTQGNLSLMRESFHGGIIAWWRREVLPLSPMAWLVWTPALVVVYSLPPGLQFPVAAVIQCFWALILVVLTDKGRKAPETVQA